jgi:hypothetical protein
MIPLLTGASQDLSRQSRAPCVATQKGGPPEPTPAYLDLESCRGCAWTPSEHSTCDRLDRFTAGSTVLADVGAVCQSLHYGTGLDARFPSNANKVRRILIRVRFVVSQSSARSQGRSPGFPGARKVTGQVPERCAVTGTFGLLLPAVVSASRPLDRCDRGRSCAIIASAVTERA